MNEKCYCLLDSGDGRKLEQFGPYRLIRPAAQAVWHPRLPRREWERADASFSREDAMQWDFYSTLPTHWFVDVGGVTFKVLLTDFGHVGLFPEHAAVWKKAHKQAAPGMRALNLFAYSGGATLALAQKGVEVCHVDASKGMVDWARENASANALDNAPIRWIVDDVFKFIGREVRRKRFYDAIILDPPSFGRGKKGEVFKIERDLRALLDGCKQLLSNTSCFVALSCHTPGYTPQVLKNLLMEMMGERPGLITAQEMTLAPQGDGYPLPCGASALFVSHE
ncbi:class I SAM-dependent methyltransferase [Simkania negevensis]|uniref:Class I SAM-dependent methyltransferase n=1 Tax=Simkania negevensis TaxID=83561 RepID=A0ABS3ASX0_9BACT|nr:class I SAM-dependent methyltransferase [Simkania negevensis]